MSNSILWGRGPTHFYTKNPSLRTRGCELEQVFETHNRRVMLRATEFFLNDEKLLDCAVRDLMREHLAVCHTTDFVSEDCFHNKDKIQNQLRNVKTYFELF